MAELFVSYTGADRAWAEWIAWILEEAGFSVVMQAWDFRPGANFVLEMHKASRDSEKTLIVLSRAYLGAEYTHPEWAAAVAKDPGGEECALIPVRVDDCAPDGLLGQIVYVDIVGLSEDEARAAILGGFDRRAKPAQAPSFPGSSGSSSAGPGALRQVLSPVPPREPDPVANTGAPTGTEALADGGAEAGPDRSERSPDARLALIEELTNVPPQQFNMIMFAVKPPSGIVPPMPAPQGDRSHALLSWAESHNGCGLALVREILAALRRRQH